jgi:hypothetical protein
MDASANDVADVKFVYEEGWRCAREAVVEVTAYITSILIAKAARTRRPNFL